MSSLPTDQPDPRPHLDTALRRLAERQYGLVTRLQIRAVGGTESAVRHRADGRLWEPVSAQVLRLVGSPRSERQRVMAAVLDTGPGSFLSHDSAAAWWGLPPFALEPCHVSRPRTGTRRTGRLATVHYPGRVSPDQVTVLDDLPLSTPTRVVFELAGIVHPARLERVLDIAWTRRMVNWDSLHRALVVLGRRGRPGIAAMRRLLDARGPDYRPTESGLERRFEQILADDGQAPMERQVDVGDEHHWIGRVDQLDREARLVVEIDSERYHAALVDSRRDAERDRALVEAGFTVLHVTDTQIWTAPRDVARRVRRARGARRTTPRPSATDT